MRTSLLFVLPLVLSTSAAWGCRSDTNTPDAARSAPPLAIEEVDAGPLVVRVVEPFLDRPLEDVQVCVVARGVERCQVTDRRGRAELPRSEEAEGVLRLRHEERVTAILPLRAGQGGEHRVPLFERVAWSGLRGALGLAPIGAGADVFVVATGVPGPALRGLRAALVDAAEEVQAYHWSEVSRGPVLDLDATSTLGMASAFDLSPERALLRLDGRSVDPSRSLIGTPRSAEDHIDVLLPLERGALTYLVVTLR